jgi:hypothetical protein
VEATQSTRSTFGVVAIVIGVIAFGLALTQFWAGPFTPQPTIEEVVADKAVKIRDAVVAKLKGEEQASSVHARSFDIDRVVTMATIVASFLAIVLAVISYIRREDKRITASAIALGGMALAVQYIAMAIGAIVLAILVAAVLSKLDFGIG